MKEKAATEAGITFTRRTLEDNASEDQLLSAVEQLNSDASVHGMLVQLPLAEHISKDAEKRVTEAVSPGKDVDGFHPYNAGLLSSRSSDPLFEPCTPAGVMALLESAQVDLKGKHAVVLGRSDIVGNPLCAMLRRKHATVTQCHSATTNVQQLIGMADVLVAAIGQPRFVQGAWLKPGAVVIDVGMNYIPGEFTGQTLTLTEGEGSLNMRA